MLQAKGADYGTALAAKKAGSPPFAFLRRGGIGHATWRAKVLRELGGEAATKLLRPPLPPREAEAAIQPQRSGTPPATVTDVHAEVHADEDGVTNAEVDAGVATSTAMPRAAPAEHNESPSAADVAADLDADVDMPTASPNATVAEREVSQMPFDGPRLEHLPQVRQAKDGHLPESSASDPTRQPASGTDTPESICPDTSSISRDVKPGILDIQPGTFDRQPGTFDRQSGTSDRQPAVLDGQPGKLQEEAEPASEAAQSGLTNVEANVPNDHSGPFVDSAPAGAAAGAAITADTEVPVLVPAPATAAAAEEVASASPAAVADASIEAAAVVPVAEPAAAPATAAAETASAAAAERQNPEDGNSADLGVRKLAKAVRARFSLVTPSRRGLASGAASSRLAQSAAVAAAFEDDSSEGEGGKERLRSESYAEAAEATATMVAADQQLDGMGGDVDTSSLNQSLPEGATAATAVAGEQRSKRSRASDPTMAGDPSRAATGTAAADSRRSRATIAANPQLARRVMGPHLPKRPSPAAFTPPASPADSRADSAHADSALPGTAVRSATGGMAESGGIGSSSGVVEAQPSAADSEASQRKARRLL